MGERAVGAGHLARDQGRGARYAARGLSRRETPPRLCAQGARLGEGRALVQDRQHVGVRRLHRDAEREMNTRQAAIALAALMSCPNAVRAQHFTPLDTTPEWDRRPRSWLSYS